LQSTIRKAEDLPPAERNISPADVVEFTDEDESIYIIGTWGGKVTRIAGLSNMTKIKVRMFQWHNMYSDYFLRIGFLRETFLTPH
jgi:hypothetical protein